MAREMKILGFNIVKIDANKNVDFQGDLNLSTNINIASVEKHKLDLVKEDSLKITATLGLSYGNLGKVDLTVTLFLLVDSKTQKEALKSWEDKKLSEEIREAIINIIFQKASLQALKIEEELGLPLHIPMPRISTGKKE